MMFGNFSKRFEDIFYDTGKWILKWSVTITTLGNLKHKSRERVAVLCISGLREDRYIYKGSCNFTQLV